MNKDELIRDYLKQIHDLEAERCKLIALCNDRAGKLAIYNDYEDDIKVYKEEINKLSELKN